MNERNHFYLFLTVTGQLSPSKMASKFYSAPFLVFTLQGRFREVDFWNLFRVQMEAPLKSSPNFAAFAQIEEVIFEVIFPLSALWGKQTLCM